MVSASWLVLFPPARLDVRAVDLALAVLDLRLRDERQLRRDRAAALILEARQLEPLAAPEPRDPRGREAELDFDLSGRLARLIRDDEQIGELLARLDCPLRELLAERKEVDKPNREPRTNCRC